MDNAEMLKRSVDSLERIYAIIIGLAIGQAINMVVQAFSTGNRFTTALKVAPAFLAFIFTIVPFFHGMNRHLDRCYIDKTDQAAHGALLFDFAVFFIESSLLFAIAGSIMSGLTPFVILGALLAFDLVWSMLSGWIHYRNVKPSIGRWAIINAATVLVGVFVYSFNAYADAQKPWLLLALACARTVVDYWLCWDFYFPQSVTTAAQRL
jgi:hypothetical protein